MSQKSLALIHPGFVILPLAMLRLYQQLNRQLGLALLLILFATPPVNEGDNIAVIGLVGP